MRKNLFIILGLFVAANILCFAFTPPTIASDLDDDILNELEPVGDVYGQETGGGVSLAQSVAQIIRAVLGFLGVIFIVLMVYAGFVWMTSGGNEEKVKKAKDTIVAATIGAAICLSAYAITYFVIDNLIQATGIEDSGLS